MIAVKYPWYTLDFYHLYEFKYAHYEFIKLNYKGNLHLTTFKITCIFVKFKQLCQKNFNWKGRNIYGPFTRDFTNQLSPGGRDITRSFIRPK